MNRPITLALAAASALVLASCARDEAAQGNPLLAHVPADTPYLYANLEPTPREVLDAFMARAQPSLDALQSMLNDIEIEINSDSEDYREARLISAILDELDGKLSLEGLESLGLSPEAHAVVYGNGPFPVVRLELANAAATRAAIARIETQSGQSFPQQELNGVAYYRIGKADSKAAVIVAILDQQLVLGLLPTRLEAEWLPGLLGQELPESPNPAEALLAINRAYDYGPYGSGFVDLDVMAEHLLNENSETSQWLRSELGQDAMRLDPVCRDEVRGMIAKTPRVTMGTTELTPTRVGFAYQFEFEKGLAEQLASLVADVPVADSGAGRALTAALGIKVGALKNFLAEKAQAIADNPYQCSHLAGLNQQAQALAAQLNQPMPFPFINNLKGFRLSLDEFDAENLDPKNVRGLFSLEVEKPQMLIGMAQMFLPGMENLQLEPGSDPVEVPQELLSIAADGVEVYAAMGRDSIGVSMGGAGQAELARFMEASGSNNGIFFSMEYDMAAQMALQDRFGAGLNGAASDDPEVQKYLNLQQTLKDSYMAW
ncbi:MAG: hypothetical protein R3348_07420, partial [Xanthomonadales bacterium]|nr:hypothetical protein [Xanthomonadales bacterium]